MAKIRKVTSSTFDSLLDTELITGDIYIVKDDNNKFNEYIIDKNKKKLLISSKNASEIFLDTSKFNYNLFDNTFKNASDKIHNEIFCWSGDRKGKAHFNKINNYMYRKLETKNRNTIYFTTPCITFSIDLTNIPGNSFKLPLSNSSRYNFIINWGDETEEQITTSNAIHDYAESKKYQITISGVCSEFNFYNNYTNSEKQNEKYQNALSEIFVLDLLSQTDCDYMFADCKNLISCECMPKRAITCNYMFSNCSKLVVTPSYSKTIRNCNYMYNGCESIVNTCSLPNTIQFASHMFDGCINLKNSPYISNSIEDCSYMFKDCKNMTSCQKLSSNMVNAEGMFKNCTNLLRSPILGKFVTNCKETFYNCTSLTNIDSSFKDNIIAEHENCYYNCININFCLSDTLSIYEIPSEWGGLYNVDYYYLKFNIDDLNTAITFESGNVLNWGDGTNSGMTHAYTSKAIYTVVVDKDVALDSSSNFNNFTRKSLYEISNFSALESACENKFKKCINLKYITKIPNNITSIKYAFSGCTSLENEIEFGDNILYANYAFENCTSLTSVSDFPVNLKSADYMFYKCSNLAFIKSLNDSLQSASNTFNGCEQLKSAPKMPNNISNVSNMYTMSGIISAPEFTPNITNASKCFASCNSLILTPKNWDKTYNKAMTSTQCYYNCPSLLILDTDTYKTNSEAMAEIPFNWK